MSDTTTVGLNVAEEMLAEQVMAALSSSIGSNAFGSFMGQLAADTVFGRIWARPGLARRERSLVTLGILIALRQSDELKVHTLAALKNGCSVQEIEETIYQTCAYVGFPAAATASAVVSATLREHGYIGGERGATKETA
jgi:4-carboxymuconolactone decarboxylase